MNNTALDLFRSAMHAAGLDYAGPILGDGKIHRFKADGDREKNSWFVLFPGPPLAGSFGCWKRGTKENWCEKRRDISAAQWRSIRRQWREAERAREQAEAKARDKAQQTAVWILSRSKPALSHPYLAAKGVKPFGDLREYRGALVLSLRDAGGQLHTLQLIDADGTKRFQRGGRIAGCFFTLADKPDGPLVLCEGYATGASIYAATGFAVVCAMNCGNFLAVVQSVRAKWLQREIIIAADNDQFTEGNPGLTKATEAARSIRAKLAVPHFADVSSQPTDFNDLHKLEGLETVKSQITNSQTQKEIAADSALEPWPDPVNGAELLNTLAGEFRRFLVLPTHADTILALWTLHTYCWEAGEYSPILAITSPVRSCGKSRVLDVLEKLVNKSFRTGNMSEAVLFRVLNSRKPSVLIDEFDTIPEERRDALANILKHGFHRSGRVHRIEGEGTKDVVEFQVFGPKALACIRLSTLDAATISRCINIRMQRKKPAAKVARLRRYDGSEWQRKCLRWTADHWQKIEAATAEMPDALGDREQDIYEPLFVLANLVGGEWPEKIRCAALALCGESSDATPDAAVLLLDWIRRYFNEANEDKVSSAALVDWINAQEDTPFTTWNNARGIRQGDLRRLLAGFEIQPNTVRLGDKTAKGYARVWFENAFVAYLPMLRRENGNTVTTPENIDDSCAAAPVTHKECDSAGNCETANKTGPCYPVTAPSAQTAPRELIEELA